MTSDKKQDGEKKSPDDTPVKISLPPASEEELDKPTEQSADESTFKTADTASDAKPSQGEPNAEKSSADNVAKDEKPAANVDTAKASKIPTLDVPIAKSASPPPPKKTGKVAAVLAFIALAGVGAGGYFGWQHLQSHEQTREIRDSEINAALQAQQQRIGELSDQLVDVSSLQDNLNRQSESVEQQSTLVTQLQGQVSSQRDRLRSLTTSTREDWLLAEAEYLLRLANQRLLTERSTDSSLALIETADKILKDFQDPDLFAVRKQLAADMLALRVAKSIDREGIYLQLSALEALIPELQLIIRNKIAGDVTPLSTLANDVNVDTSSGSWLVKLQTNILKAFSELGSIVRIVDRGTPFKQMLGPQEESLVRQNLRFMLEQAELALLQENAVVFRTSLEKCRDWIAQYFDLNPQSRVLVTQLTELSTTNVVQVLPDISGSLEMLRDYVNLWHIRHDGDAMVVPTDDLSRAIIDSAAPSVTEASIVQLADPVIKPVVESMVASIAYRSDIAKPLDTEGALP